MVRNHTLDVRVHNPTKANRCWTNLFRDLRAGSAQTARCCFRRESFLPSVSGLCWLRVKVPPANDKFLAVDTDGETLLPARIFFLSASGLRCRCVKVHDKRAPVDTDAEALRPTGLSLLSVSGLCWRRAKVPSANENLARVDTDAEVLIAAGKSLLSGSGPGWLRSKIPPANDNRLGVDTDAEMRLPAGMFLLSGSGPGRRPRLLGRSVLRRSDGEQRVFGVGVGFGQGQQAFPLVRRMPRFHVRSALVRRGVSEVHAGHPGASGDWAREIVARSG